MAVSLYFGLPRTGKTTLLAKMAVTEAKRYEYVYTNVHLTDVPDNVYYIENEWIGKYQLENCLILIDEATLFADNRDYKNFSKDLVKFFMLHGHYHCTIRLFAQTYNGVDKKIRTLCELVYYMYKPFLTGHWITKYYRIPYGIVIPDRRKNKQTTGNSLGEIEEGYCKPNLIERIFAHRLHRRKYYPHFNSWEAPVLPPPPCLVEKDTSLKAADGVAPENTLPDEKEVS